MEMVEMPLLCNAAYVGKSKMYFYEIPYTIKGSIKHTGPKDKPKSVCKDRTIGTWEGRNEE